MLATVMLTLVLSVFIGFYYWSNQTLESIRYLPLQILIAAFSYILLQIVKRRFIRPLNRVWWDWLYYPGLLVMVLPMYWADEQHLFYWLLLSDVGILFLVITPILDLKLIFIKR